MPQKQTDLTGIVATFVRAGEHTEESVRDAVLERAYDGVWLRVSRGRIAGPRRTELLRVDLLDVDQGAALRDDELFAGLSAGGRTLVHVAFGDLTVFRDRKLLTPEEAAAVLRDDLGAELDTLVDLEELETGQDGGEPRPPLTLALAHGRVLDTGPMPPPPAFFRFRDRTLGLPGEEPGADRALIFACDLEEAKALYTERPARETLELLTSLEPRELAARLGPFAHAVQAAVEQLERAGDRPPATLGDPGLFELLCVLEGYGAMAGESVAYLDERFFPLLALRTGAQLPALDKEELLELEDLGLLDAMTEVLPYSVPEGQLLQSFADSEVTPAAVAAGQPSGEVVEASVFTLRTERVVEQVRAFDPERLSREVERFARHWHAQQGGALKLGEFEAWAQARAQKDQRDLDRFLLTLNDLDAVLDTADRNGLAVTLAFYAAEAAESADGVEGAD